MIRLANAVICLDCDCIYHDSSPSCPMCNSKQRYHISWWIPPLYSDITPAIKMRDKNGEETKKVSKLHTA